MANEVKKTTLQSANFWTNVATVIVGIVLAFFTPDLPTSGQISGEVANIVGAIKTANYGLLITALFNVGNILFHLFKK